MSVVVDPHSYTLRALRKHVIDDFNDKYPPNDYKKVQWTGPEALQLIREEAVARDIHQDKEAVKRMIRFLKDAEKEHIEYIKRDKLKPEDVSLHYYGDELIDDSKLLVNLFKPRDGIVL